MTHEERLKLARGSLDGLRIGDAFGQQFFGSALLPELLEGDRPLPVGPWRWTDDTAMALSIVESLAEHRAIDSDFLARRFSARHHDEPDRGYGPGAHVLLQAIYSGAPWGEASESMFGGSGSFGNGAAMRCAPIGAYFWDDLDAVVEHAGRSAVPTHTHPEGRAGAVAVALAAAFATRSDQGESRDEPTAFTRLVAERCPDGEVRTGLEKAAALPRKTSVQQAASKLGCGENISAQDTVPFCVWASARFLGRYEDAMWEVARALGDRDTTCAIVGGIVVLSTGAVIPDEWRRRAEDAPEQARPSVT